MGERSHEPEQEDEHEYEKWYPEEQSESSVPALIPNHLFPTSRPLLLFILESI